MLACYFHPPLYAFILGLFDLKDSKPEYRVDGDTTIDSAHSGSIINVFGINTTGTHQHNIAGIASSISYNNNSISNVYFGNSRAEDKKGHINEYVTANDEYRSFASRLSCINDEF